jgi:hypothetical protein
MMQSQQQASERSMQMMLAMMGQFQQAQATTLQAMMGGRDKFSEVAAIFSPLLAREPAGGGGRLGEFKEMLDLAKGLLPAPAGGGEDDSIAGLAFKALSPAIPDLAKGFSDFAATRRAEAAGQAEVRPVDYTRETAPPAPQVAHAGSGRFPLLAEIRTDVLFYFGRRIDPEIAADALWDVLTGEALKAKGFTEADVVPILATLNGAGQRWLDELAGEGLDLRADPTWAHGFLNALVAIYRGEDGSPFGGGGGEGDTSGDGQPGAVGVTANGGAKSGAGDNEKPAP